MVKLHLKATMLAATFIGLAAASTYGAEGPATWDGPFTGPVQTEAVPANEARPAAIYPKVIESTYEPPTEGLPEMYLLSRQTLKPAAVKPGIFVFFKDGDEDHPQIKPPLAGEKPGSEYPEGCTFRMKEGETISEFAKRFLAAGDKPLECCRETYGDGTPMWYLCTRNVHLLKSHCEFCQDEANAEKCKDIVDDRGRPKTTIPSYCSEANYGCDPSQYGNCYYEREYTCWRTRFCASCSAGSSHADCNSYCGSSTR